MGLKVAVLAGGKSAEREVSLNSGSQVAKGLETKGHQVKLLDPAAAGFINDLTSFNPEAVFIALHGQWGEDGAIQGFLETLGFPYTGSGVSSSAVAINKELTKMVLNRAGLPTPAGLLIKKEEFEGQGSKGILPAIKDLGLPLIVKPNTQGSTIGLKLVKQLDELDGAIREAFKYDCEVLIEEMVTGTEITAGVLGTKELQALPVIEITSENELYDYQAKYTKGMSHHIIPARLRPEVLEKVQDYAVRTHRAMGCRGMSRVDMIVAEGRITILEINTIPGMTATSLLPDAAAAVGISFEDLCERILQSAFENEQ